MSWGDTIIPKSDQINADDLIAGPITIKITSVKINMNDQQSGIVHYEGEKGKPYKPCKSMRRVMAIKWGNDETQFVGKSMTLERDPTVKWAGEEVGGIRITHMSDMKNDDRFMLTFSRGSKKPVKINHLKPAAPTESPEEKAKKWANQAAITIADFTSLDELTGWRGANDKWFEAVAKYGDISTSLVSEYDKKLKELTGD